MRIVASVGIVASLAGPASSEAQQNRCPPNPETWRGLQVCPESPRDESVDFGEYPDDLRRKTITLLPDTMKGDGGVYMPFTCEWYRLENGAVFFPVARQLIVSRGEALDSGIDPDDALGFTAHLDNYTITDEPVSDAGEGQEPRLHAAWFAQQVIDVKRRWELSVDQVERDALERMLTTSVDRVLSCTTPTALTFREPSISVVVEGGDSLVVFVATNLPAPAGGTQVTITTEGTATLGVDYRLQSGITISEGERIGALDVTADTDAEDEGGETIILSASSTNPTLQTKEPLTLTIQDSTLVPALPLAGSVFLAVLLVHLFRRRRSGKNG